MHAIIVKVARLVFHPLKRCCLVSPTALIHLPFGGDIAVIITEQQACWKALGSLDRDHYMQKVIL